MKYRNVALMYTADMLILLVNPKYTDVVSGAIVKTLDYDTAIAEQNPRCLVAGFPYQSVVNATPKIRLVSNLDSTACLQKYVFESCKQVGKPILLFRGHHTNWYLLIRFKCPDDVTKTLKAVCKIRKVARRFGGNLIRKIARGKYDEVKHIIENADEIYNILKRYKGRYTRPLVVRMISRRKGKIDDELRNKIWEVYRKEKKIVKLFGTITVNPVRILNKWALIVIDVKLKRKVFAVFFGRNAFLKAYDVIYEGKIPKRLRSDEILVVNDEIINMDEDVLEEAIKCIKKMGELEYNVFLKEFGHIISIVKL